MTNPQVSVLVPTYNHKKYIEQTLKSILAQKTTFDLEILVGDDASTDGTTAILKEKFTQNKVIKLFLHEENLGEKGKKNFQYLLSLAKGKYIAICEGDDYWTDVTKLQKQVELLEKEPSLSMCFHNVFCENESKKETRHYLTWEQDRVITFEDMLSFNPIPTCSILFRRKYLTPFPLWVHKISVGDWPLWLHILENGNATFINFFGGVYLEHHGGTWSTKADIEKQIEFIKIYKHIKKSVNTKYSQQINDLISGRIKTIINLKYKEKHYFSGFLYAVYFYVIYKNKKRIEYRINKMKSNAKS